ncbi:MAG: hypothetical protein ACRYFX_02980 [Janthinobacterium lividum]
MPPTHPQPGIPSPAVLGWYNAVPNLLWSGLALAPVGYFCYRYVEWPWLCGFGAASLLAYA